MSMLSAEEKLLEAIFGDEEVPPSKCIECGKELEYNTIWYEEKPYYSYCLPHSEMGQR